MGFSLTTSWTWISLIFWDCMQPQRSELHTYLSYSMLMTAILWHIPQQLCKQLLQHERAYRRIGLSVNIPTKRMSSFSGLQAHDTKILFSPFLTLCWLVYHISKTMGAFSLKIAALIWMFNTGLNRPHLWQTVHISHFTVHKKPIISTCRGHLWTQ